MNFDDLQKNWQSQQGNFKSGIDSNLLLKEVQKNEKHLESVVLWRDIREVVVAFLLFLLFLYFGLKLNILPIYLLALASLGIAVFMVADRIIQKRKQPKPSQSLASYTESSLKKINHQIWLLKNVLWWYLLPSAIGVGVFISYGAFKISQNSGLENLTWWLLFLFGSLFISILVFWGIYILNRRVVQNELVPRQKELEQLLQSFKNGNE